MIVVENLDYFNIEFHISHVCGGVYTYTSTRTYADSGIGYADSTAIAVGDYTYTEAKTSTNVYSDSTHALTDSFGAAKAYAGANYGDSRSWSTSLSLSIET